MPAPWSEWLLSTVLESMIAASPPFQRPPPVPLGPTMLPEIMLLWMLAKPKFQMPPPLPTASLFMKKESMTVREPLLNMPPPLSSAWLSSKTLPAPRLAVFPKTRSLVMVSKPLLLLAMPPPESAELNLISELSTASVALLKMPPPTEGDWLFSASTSLSVRSPPLNNPPAPCRMVTWEMSDTPVVTRNTKKSATPGLAFASMIVVSRSAPTRWTSCIDYQCGTQC